MGADDKERILKELQPLFDQAEKEGLWFYCGYENLWFAPDELMDNHDNGKFIWGVVNWTLRNPLERIYELKTKITLAQGDLDRFQSRMEKYNAKRQKDN